MSERQAPYQASAGRSSGRLIIGIDPGSSATGKKRIGAAVYHPDGGRLLEVRTASFWELLVWLDERYAAVARGGSVAYVVLEDTRGLGLFSYHDKQGSKAKENRRQRDGRAIRLGKLFGVTDLIEQWLKWKGFEVVLVRPLRGPMAKLPADKFERLTGWAGRTSQDARDAAMHVWGRSAAVPASGCASKGGRRGVV